MTILDKIFRNYSLRRLIKNADNGLMERRYHTKDELKTCVVLVKAGDYTVDKLILKTPYISFEKVAFLPQNFKGELRSDIVYVKNTEVGFGGKIRNEAFSKMVGKSYDMLIDLSEGAAELENYFLKASRAAFRIGFRSHESHDLVIDAVKDENDFIDKLFDLLSKLKKY